MRVGIAQINSTLGDFEGNKSKILTFTLRALERKCSLVVFPECALFGYHPFDLLERKDFVTKQNKYLNELHRQLPKGIAVLVGGISSRAEKRGRPYYNSAFLLAKNKPIRAFHKELLPTGDVFDEARFIESGTLEKNYFQLHGHRFFITICEDIWAWPDANGFSSYKNNPLTKVPKKKVSLVINMSASPYHVQKMKSRLYVTQKTAQHFKAPVLYVNLVGAQDEIIYDGQSFVMTPKGKKVLACEAFQEDLNVFDLKEQEAWHHSQALTEIESLRRALVLGISDFCQKAGLSRIHLGLSGGIDSAVVACLAVDAIGSDSVETLAMPGPFSDSKSLDLAQLLAKKLRVQCHPLPITTLYEAVLAEFRKAFNYDKFGIVNENIQARLRGLLLMAFANHKQSLLLSTSNKSEAATGYTTLYGDMCGGLAPIADLTKKQVYALARHYNSDQELIPKEILDRPPSAELRPNQKDQDSLPSYEDLDESVERIVTQSGPIKNNIDTWLLSTLLKTEFKRWQSPPILKISAHSFGRGRRWPVAHRLKIK